MKLIALQFTYHTDIIEVPDKLAPRIRSIQSEFDKWLYDKTIDHKCWIFIQGQKAAVSFGSNDFVDFINNYILCNSPEKAKLVQKNAEKIPAKIRKLYF